MLAGFTCSVARNGPAAGGIVGRHCIDWLRPGALLTALVRLAATLSSHCLFVAFFCATQCLGGGTMGASQGRQVPTRAVCARATRHPRTIGGCRACSRSRAVPCALVGSKPLPLPPLRSPAAAPACAPPAGAGSHVDAAAGAAAAAAAMQAAASNAAAAHCKQRNRFMVMPLVPERTLCVV